MHQPENLKIGEIINSWTFDLDVGCARMLWNSSKGTNGQLQFNNQI